MWLTFSCRPSKSKYCVIFLYKTKVQSNTQDDYDDDYESDDEDENAEEDKLHVPLTVSVIVLSIYTLIGAVIFPAWEDWSTANAAYFSFITISTIGFGDLVPGNGRFTEVNSFIHHTTFFVKKEKQNTVV